MRINRRNNNKIMKRKSKNNLQVLQILIKFKSKVKKINKMKKTWLKLMKKKRKRKKEKILMMIKRMMKIKIRFKMIKNRMIKMII